MLMELNPLYWMIVGPTMLLALYAQMKVKSAFATQSQVANRLGLTGAQAAAHVMAAGGVTGVTIEESEGFLSDHYDPTAKALRLSPDVYHGRSVAAIGVGAHEAGHAIQHANGYAPLAIRSAVVPMASIGSWLSMPLIIAGFLMQSLGLVQLGIVAFGAVVAFQLVTLPVEFDASRRAKLILADIGATATAEEADGVASVLSAAALTYVAATLTAVAQLIYFIMLTQRRD